MQIESLYLVYWWSFVFTRKGLEKVTSLGGRLYDVLEKVVATSISDQCARSLRSKLTGFH